MKCFKIIFIFSLILHFGFCNNTFAQGLNNNWITGYSSFNGYPELGVSKLNFQFGAQIINSNPIEMEFNQTLANISDTNGNMLFYTNGYYIADSNGDTMQNGTNINPSFFTNGKPDGLTIPQSHLILPKPGSSNIFYLFHTTIDSLGNPYWYINNLYLSEIDMSLNSGLGAVTIKNQIIKYDSLTLGKISATKHGNGRDWWVIVPGAFSNQFYKFIVTTTGISGQFTQNIGTPRIARMGQASFSNDGSKYFQVDLSGELEVFSFDRCSGELSNPELLTITFSETIKAAFSNNGSKIYAGAEVTLFQVDLLSANIQASKTIVAVWDSFYSVAFSINIPTLFQHMSLAPDGNIYITTGGSTFYYHIIEEPDSLGAVCNVIQHGLTLPHLYFNTLPNHPNYHLGPLLGSACDTIVTGLPPPEVRLTLKLYPNPNSGTFQITYTPLPENLTLQVFNILGKEMHAQLLPQWSQLQNIHIGNLPAGVYMASITSSKSKKSVKFVVE